MRNRSSGPRVSTPIVSPIAKCFSFAVFVSIAISSARSASARPSDERVEALVALWIDAEARFGAPPFEDHLVVAVDELRLAAMPPSATATPGRLRTRASSDSASEAA